MRGLRESLPEAQTRSQAGNRLQPTEPLAGRPSRPGEARRSGRGARLTGCGRRRTPLSLTAVLGALVRNGRELAQAEIERQQPGIRDQGAGPGRSVIASPEIAMVSKLNMH